MEKRDLKMDWSVPWHKTDSNSWWPTPHDLGSRTACIQNRYYFLPHSPTGMWKSILWRATLLSGGPAMCSWAINPKGHMCPWKILPLPARKQNPLDASLWIDKDHKPYMIYCWEWFAETGMAPVEKKNWNPIWSGTAGEGKILFPSDTPWSREKDAPGKDKFNKVTDGLCFKNKTGKLGMIWDQLGRCVHTQGVAYSASGTSMGHGCWRKNPLRHPILVMVCCSRTLEGKLLMVLHSHKNVNRRYIRIPHLFEVMIAVIDHWWQILCSVSIYYVTVWL